MNLFKNIKNNSDQLFGILVPGAALAFIVFIIMCVVRFFWEMFFDPLAFLRDEEPDNTGFWIAGVILYIIIAAILCLPNSATNTRNRPPTKQRPKRRKSYPDKHFLDPDFDYNDGFGMDE